MAWQSKGKESCSEGVAMGKRQFLSFLVDTELLRQLDEFRFRWRFRSRAEAIRWLLDWALGHGAEREAKG